MLTRCVLSGTSLGSLATLNLTALKETSACLDHMQSLEWNSYSITDSQLVSITTVETYRRSSGSVIPPPRDVISCPVRALLACWWSTWVSDEGVIIHRGCHLFLSEVGPCCSWAKVSRTAQQWWVFDTQERWSVAIAGWVTSVTTKLRDPGCHSNTGVSQDTMWSHTNRHTGLVGRYQFPFLCCRSLLCEWNLNAAEPWP